MRTEAADALVPPEPCAAVKGASGRTSRDPNVAATTAAEAGTSGAHRGGAITDRRRPARAFMLRQQCQSPSDVRRRR